MLLVDRIQTEEEVGRQQKGMDKPRVHHVPESGREQKMTEESGCEVICGTQTTLMAKT